MKTKLTAKDIIGKFIAINDDHGTRRRKIKYAQGNKFEWIMGWAKISELKLKNGKLTLNQFKK